MSGKLRGLQRRLAIAERTFARIAKQAALANCVCVDDFFPNNADDFEVEMNRVCPVHGFRSLGEIERIYFVNPDRSVVKDHKFDELIKIYEERRARYMAGK
jgi:hypothetical protein